MMKAIYRVDAVTGSPSPVQQSKSRRGLPTQAAVLKHQAFTETPAENIDATADVVIVGGGGAGVTAAVKALGKRRKRYPHRENGVLGQLIVAGGIYNARP
jgi:hypothetical protein